MKRKGTDISAYQGQPDFSKVKTQADFVIIRAGYGRYSSQKDKCFERNYSECKKHGIPCGAYWFSYSVTAADAKKEAKACLEAIKGKQFEYPIYYDIEGGSLTDKATVSAMCREFCGELEKNGYFAGIYMSRIPAQNYLTEDVKKRYALWLAEYGGALKWQGLPGMWQYSSTGRINGIAGNVDLDECYEDYPGIIRSAGLNGFSGPEVLDSSGMKRGDDSAGVYAYKSLLRTAALTGVVSVSVDSNGIFGEGTEKATNALLKKWGYRQNGIAGEKLIKRLYEETAERIKG